VLQSVAKIEKTPFMYNTFICSNEKNVRSGLVGAEDRNRKKTILIVEDEAIIGLSESKILGDAGFEAFLVNNAEKAIAAVAGKKVDLILMDIDLGRGKMDGTEAVNMAFELFEAHQHLKQENEARKMKEKELSASERKFRFLTEMAPIGIYLADAEGRCTYVNDKWCSLSGMGYDDAMGEGWKNAVHPGDRDRIYTLWQETVKTGEEASFEYRFGGPGGKIRWVYGLAKPLMTEAGSIEQYIGVNVDITDLISAENRLRENQKLLKEALGLADIGVRYDHTNKISGLYGVLRTELV
jgi:PAS domain S-box-containing protein